MPAAALRTTRCGRGHLHSPWNTSGILRIAKCESVCGFCRKETKTAANLRKHVAIHIKNEGLNLTIAEGSSGRGRLEMPSTHLDRSSDSHKHISQPVYEESRRSFSPDSNSSSTSTTNTSTTSNSYLHPYRPSAVSYHSSDALSPSAVMSIASNSLSSSHPPSHPKSPSSQMSYSPATYMSPSSSLPFHHYIPSPMPHSHAYPTPCRTPPDPFRSLRPHKITTRAAWIPMPASEAIRILDLCKSLSQAFDIAHNQSHDHHTHDHHTHNYAPHNNTAVALAPCYNRATIFDEEWQAHMKDVHGVFLLWPETWMKRVEVLDLDRFGGDIGACNEVLIDSEGRGGREGR